MSVIGYRHTGIVVDDLELQLKFYRDLLELDIYYDQYEFGLWLSKILPMNVPTSIDPIKTPGTARIIKLGKNNQRIVELIQFSEWIYRDMKVKDYNEVGITHIALQVDKLNEMYENMKSKGVSFISPPRSNPDKTVKVCFCYDFEGNLIELVQVL